MGITVFVDFNDKMWCGKNIKLILQHYDDAFIANKIGREKFF